MIHAHHISPGQTNFSVKQYDYDPDSAHTVEVLREVNADGQLGSFGFTLNNEKPPIVGTVVPGGPADRAGLKTQEVVTAVNAQETLTLSHQEVVAIISNTKTAGVWLTVCDPSEENNVGGRLHPVRPAIPSHVNNRLRVARVSSLNSLSSFSTSSPAIPRNMMDGGRPKYSNDDAIPNYHDLPKYTPRANPPGTGINNRLGSAAFASSAMVLGKGHQRQVFTHNPQTNGVPSTTNSQQFPQYQQQQQQPPRQLYHQPLQQRSSVPINGQLSVNKSDPSLMSLGSKPSPTPAATNFTSASVMVTYIGPVEIPDAWSKRELSSKCLQECTRNLLSQRQDFVEAFLEVTLTSMRILSVSHTVIFKHKREELYYAGVCTDDELYFGIVTRKVDHKGNKKSLSGSNLMKANRAHLCHVFKVIEHQSVLILHSGGPKDSKGTKNNKQQQLQQYGQQTKQKTIPIMSSITIVNAIQGLFTSSSTPSTKILDDVVGIKPFSGSAENMLSNGSQDKLKKKKLDVVDLRPSAYSPMPSSSSGSTGLIGSGLNSITQTTANMYVSVPHSSGSLPVNRGNSGVVISHNRSQSNPANLASTPGMPPPDYPVSIGTPIFHQRAGGHGGSGSSGGGGIGGGGGGTSWYASDSPMEGHHSRAGSWDAKGSPNQGRSSRGRSPKNGGNGGVCYQNDSPGSHRAHGPRRGGARKPAGHIPFQYDKVKRFSDDSSVSSSLSDSRASSPTRISHRSSFTSHSRSPSPSRSPSFSSHSRSPSPVLPSRTSHSKSHKTAGSRMSASTRRARMEVAMSIRIASRASAMTANPPLRRQGSESSIMDIPDFKATGGVIGGTVMSPGVRGTPVHAGLPPKNGPLSSSIGSIATTIVDTVGDDPEECGRVAGWVASFDKLLADPLGVHTLTLFLKKEHCEENILFWKDTQEFKETAATNKNLSASVKKIYDEYLAPQSANTVNVDDRVKKSIESRMTNPPLDIFNEAFEQIYQLMKMDCYPRFKKSALVKDCLMAEMEGKPLPIDLPHNQEHEEQTSQAFPGIWKKHREFGFGRSLFGRFTRGRVHHDQPPPPADPPMPSDGGIWGVTMDSKPVRTSSTSSTPDSKDSKRKKDKSAKDGSPRLRKTYSAKESKKRRSAAGMSSGSDSKTQSTSSLKDTSAPASEEMSPEDHLNIFQSYKKNMFEVNLPSKVTKIMEVPPSGTVEEAIQPVLRKHGYSLDIMELRFANNLKLIDLSSPASILVGQHISVIKSKNTFIASFPDVLERILPADGKKTVGDLFVGIMKEMGKLQNFSVAVEGARVPLDFETDTSALVGQRVVVKYLPGPLIYKGENLLESSTGRTDMDDLFSMIERLSSDTLGDQRVSPTPLTSDQSDSEQAKRPLSSELNPSPGEMRRRSQTQSKSTGRNGRPNLRPLSHSKSSESIDCPCGNVHQQPNSHSSFISSGSSSSSSQQHNRMQQDKLHGAHLRPPPTANSSSSSFGSDSAHFSRTHSGSSTNSRPYSHDSSVSPTSTSGVGSHHRSLSPPGSSDSYPSHRRRTTSPPPPTSKPPPLPSHAKRHSGPRNMQPPSRWSLRSTDSTSSEDSLTADIQSHPKLYNRYGEHQGGPQSISEHPQGYPGNRRSPPGAGNNTRPYRQSGGYPGDYPPHSLDSVVKEAYRSSPSNQNPGSKGNVVEHQQVSRKTSWQGQQGRGVDYSNASHPLQNSVSTGQSRSIGGSLSSHTQASQHRRSAHTLPSQQRIQPAQAAQPVRRAQVPARTAAQRKELVENPQLIKAGDQLVEQELDEYRKHTKNPKPGRSMDVLAHPSPETFV